MEVESPVCDGDRNIDDEEVSDEGVGDGREETDKGA